MSAASRSRTMLHPGFFATLLLVAVAVMLCPANVRADGPTAGFDAANKLYEEAKYSEAAAAYQKLIQAGQVSAAVYFNLGNAFFKAGHLGLAIKAYHDAAGISPRDPDLRANLQFAREQTQGPTLLPGRWQRALNWLTLNEWTLLACGFVWLWFVSYSFAQLRPSSRIPLRNSLILVAVVGFASCGCLAAAFQQNQSARTAIVISRNATVRHGPLPEAPEAFLVHDGAELRVLDQKDEWLQVEVGQRIGWLRKDEVLLPARL